MKYLLIFSIFFVLFTSCSKNIELEDITGKWELVKLYPEKVVTKEKDNIYTIEFKTDNTIKVRLDVNSCWSTYNLEDNNQISFGRFGCTLVCCDTEYAEEFINIVAASNTITIRFGKLILEGDNGKAKLKRIEQK